MWLLAETVLYVSFVLVFNQQPTDEHKQNVALTNSALGLVSGSIPFLLGSTYWLPALAH